MEKLAKILEKSSEKAEESELFYMNTLSDTICFEAGKVLNMESSQNEGIALRVKKNGKTGFSTSTAIKDTIIEKALENSEFGEACNFDFAKDRIEFSEKNYINEYIDKLTPAGLLEKGEKIIKTIRDFDRRFTVNISFTKKLQEIYLLTSSGFFGTYRKNYYTGALTVQLTRKDDIFKVHRGFSDSKHLEDKEDRMIKKILFDLEHGMKVEKIEKGKYPVLFTPRGLAPLMALFSSGVNGSIVFKKLSPLHSKSGEEIFDRRLTVYDTSLEPGAEKYIPFDDEGTEGQKTLIIEKGILKKFLLDRKYGEKFNKPSTGNSLRQDRRCERGYENYPSIGPNTVVIEPGDVLSNDLTANIKKGLLIEFAPSLFFGPMRGDLSATVLQGYKIENGKIAGRVKNTVISGNLYNLFKDLVLEISSDTAFADFFSFNFKLPYILFRDVDIVS